MARIRKLPLLVVACYCWLYHAYIITALPDPFFEPDSNGYMDGPLQQILGRGFNVPISRGLGYPLFLWTGLKFFGTFHALLWIQHFLWMAMAGVTVALFLKYCPKRYAWASVLLFIVGCSPMGAILSHSILADAPYTAWQMSAIGGLLGLFGESLSINGTICGISLAIAINTRPTGKLLVLSIALVHLIRLGNERYRRMATATAISFALAMSPFLLYNYFRRHFSGVETFGTFYAVGDALKHIAPAEIRDTRTRELLTPFYTHQGENRFLNSNWIWYASDGPIHALKADPETAARIHTIYWQLLIQAATRHPLAYLKDLYEVGATTAREGTRNVQTVPDKTASVIFALRTYYQSTISYPEARRFLFFRPDTAPAYFETIKRSALPPFDRKPPLFFPIWLLAQAYAMLSWIGILSIGWLVWRAWREPVVQILLLTVVSQIIMIAVGGVFVPRYGIPLEPLYALAAFLALQLNSL